MWKSNKIFLGEHTFARFVAGIAYHSYVLIRLPLPAPLLQNIFLHHALSSSWPWDIFFY